MRKNVSRWNQTCPGGQNRPQQRATALVFIMEIFPSGTQSIAPCPKFNSRCLKKTAWGMDPGRMMEPDYVGLHPTLCLPHMWGLDMGWKAECAGPFQCWVMKEATRKWECVLKRLCLQKPNVVAFVTGRAFTQSFCLQIARLSASANILQGAGLALFHLQDDSGFLENKMSL